MKMLTYKIISNKNPYLKKIKLKYNSIHDKS